VIRGSTAAARSPTSSDSLSRVRLLACALILASGCAGNVPPCDPLTTPGDYSCGMPGWEERGFALHLPPNFDTGSNFPVVLVLHGGASDATKMRGYTCGERGGDRTGCLDDVAEREGFVTVYAEGTPTAGLSGIRAWNAGGGMNGFRCVSGPACRDGVDDIAFTRNLLDELGRLFRVERTRVYVAGFSNGGAMAHRLACELSDRFAAIAAVSGANQAAEVQGCEPSRPVPILQIHGSGDPCWLFTGGAGACFEEEGEDYVGVSNSMTGWARRHHCSLLPPMMDLLDDVDPGDETRVERSTWRGCDASLVLMKIGGGGHTWPSGEQFRPVSEVGRVSHDIDANEQIWSFFKDRAL